MLRRTLASLLLAALVALAPAGATERFTVSTAPSCGATDFFAYGITDGANAATCSTGSGSSKNNCLCSGGTVTVVAPNSIGSASASLSYSSTFSDFFVDLDRDNVLDDNESLLTNKCLTVARQAATTTLSASGNTDIDFDTELQDDCGQLTIASDASRFTFARPGWKHCEMGVDFQAVSVVTVSHIDTSSDSPSPQEAHGHPAFTDAQTGHGTTFEVPAGGTVYFWIFQSGAADIEDAWAACWDVGQ